MKKLIVSIYQPGQLMSLFKKALREAKKGRLKDRFEISFSDKKQFDRFVKNLWILAEIRKHKPKSIYELSRLVDMDLSNTKKIIAFFEDSKVIRIKISKINGRTVKTPIVEYDEISFALKAS